jgi:hypothetical protein
MRPYLKEPITKNWAGRLAQGEGPEFKPQHHTPPPPKKTWYQVIYGDNKSLQTKITLSHFWQSIDRHVVRVAGVLLSKNPIPRYFLLLPI